jgi:probable F420-dependent oxidoreductase
VYPGRSSGDAPTITGSGRFHVRPRSRAAIACSFAVVRVGLVTPVLTLLPRAHAQWERDATFDDVVTVARAADRLGFDHLTCSEHVAIPEAVAETRGARYWDPLATFGALSAHTERIDFATFVLVLGYHHPLEIAKRYGTLDRITGGRVVLGLGVGSLREEFDLLDVPFDDRGERADDAIRALRACLGRARPEYHGTHFDIEGFIIDPCATRNDLPLWIGGRTARSLRRAVELADAWAPFALDPAEVKGMLDRAADTPAWHERARPLSVWLQPAPLDPTGEPDATVATLAALRSAGATGVSARLVHRSRDHLIEQMAALIELVPPD